MMIDGSKAELCPVAHLKDTPGALTVALPSAVLPIEIPGDSGISLLTQAEGLGRTEVMRQVVGPAFTTFLRPLYQEGLCRDELAKLSVVNNFAAMENFIDELKYVGQVRAEALITTPSGSKIYNELDELREGRPDLFYYPKMEAVIRDAVSSGIVTPLTLATQIYAAEHFDSEISAADIRKSELTLEGILEIMQRPEFDAMLLKLTKGPNGFLGQRSSAPDISKKQFFQFYNPSKCPEWRGDKEDLGYAEWLTIWEAFKTEGGKVVGFSDQYHLAADLKRKELGWEWRRSPMSRGRYEFNNSSGCPVRHSFEDESGEKQEPLIITAKNFLIRALEASAQP